MLCEVCGKTEASIRITETLGGVQRVRHLCEECWREDKGRPEVGVRCPGCEAYVPAGDLLCPNCLAGLPGGSFDIEAYRRQVSLERAEVTAGARVLGGLLILLGMGLVAFMMISQGGFFKGESFVASWRGTMIAAELAVLGVIVFAAGLGLLCLRMWAYQLSYWGAAFLMVVCIWQVLVKLQQAVLDPQAGFEVGGSFLALVLGFVAALFVVSYLSTPEVREPFGR